MTTSQVQQLTYDLKNMLQAANVQLSSMLPSEWAEAKRRLTKADSSIDGRFSYYNTPYCREIVDCYSPLSPVKIFAVMKGAQIGVSTGVIENAIGYTIDQNPCNIMYITGHDDLVEEGVAKIDRMIDSCGIRHLIRPNTSNRKSSKTGDTTRKKEFLNGSLVTGAASNHKLFMQRSAVVGAIDDVDAVKKASKTDGSTYDLILQRFAANYDTMKLGLFTTPRLLESSIIYPIYLKGDQRKYMPPCQCCHKNIQWEWSIDIPGTDGKEKAGIYYKLDNMGKVIPSSVGYICQLCSGFFTDKYKMQMLNDGHWQPTAVATQEFTRSYHISALYAPHGMFDWYHYAAQYVDANPQNAAQDPEKQQTFDNLVLGIPYKPAGEAPSATKLQTQNIRAYKPGIVPQKQSVNDGNGNIVLITLAADLNGTVYKEGRFADDARLDYEIVAWAENGTSYHVKHGSIGTFVPRENTHRIKTDRQRWTYEHHRPNSVWPVLSEIINSQLLTDENKPAYINIVGIDTGHYTNYAYEFIDRYPHRPLVVGLKGKDVDRYILQSADKHSYSNAVERGGLYLVNVNQVKDYLNKQIDLNWDPRRDETQPAGFINFPQPTDGLYLLNNYFSHYTAEHRVTNKNENTPGYRWEKVNAAAQNHFWDVRVYSMVLCDIMTDMVCAKIGIKKGTWKDYVDFWKRINQPK